MEADFWRLSNLFWTDSWTDKMVTRFLENLAHGTDEEVHELFTSKELRENSDWMFDSFLIHMIGRFKTLLPAAIKKRLLECLLGKPNVIASFRFLETKVIPGTVYRKCRK